jgi:hypothetical protein
MILLLPAVHNALVTFCTDTYPTKHADFMDLDIYKVVAWFVWRETFWKLILIKRWTGWPWSSQVNSMDCTDNLEQRFTIKSTFALHRSVDPVENTIEDPSCRGGNNHSPTRQMRVEFGIGEYFLNLLARLARKGFFLIESYSSRIPKYKHTSDTVFYLLLWHTHRVMMVYFSSRPSTKGTLNKCSAKTWFWRVFLWFGETNFELLANLASALNILISPLPVVSLSRRAQDMRTLRILLRILDLIVDNI